jgi:hypothetical protein
VEARRPTIYNRSAKGSNAGANFFRSSGGMVEVKTWEEEGAGENNLS